MKKERHITNTFVKECIAQALIKLLKNKPLSAITITELTATAGVSRMAYYRNFNSKEEIFSSYFEIILCKYAEASEHLSPNGIYYDVEHMTHYFNFILEHKEFLGTLAQSGYGNVFLDSVTNYIIDKWLTDSKNRMEYYTLYAFSGSLYNLYIAWAKHNYNGTPEEMAQILFHIHNHPLKDAYHPKHFNIDVPK